MLAIDQCTCLYVYVVVKKKCHPGHVIYLPVSNIHVIGLLAIVLGLHINVLIRSSWLIVVVQVVIQGLYLCNLATGIVLSWAWWGVVSVGMGGCWAWCM